jgi:DNA-binding response OmpR family regulator
MDTNAADPDLKTTPMTPGPQTILVIEDDMSVQMFVAQVLKNAGYLVLVAADMQEALNMSDVTVDIHLILTDIMLPTSNGMEIAEALVAKRPRTPVLYMSGAGSDAIHALQFEGAPVGEFLHKPFSPEMLLGKIRAMLLEVTAELAVPQTAAASALSPEAALRGNSDAVYRLESSVRCPHCNETISTLQAVRLLRMQVNFTSTLPRRGRALVCSSCGAIVSAELTTF